MSKNFSILFQYATRSRSNNFFRGLDSIVKNVNSDSYMVNVVCDWDDHAMFDMAVLTKLRDDYKNVQLCFGRSKNKIDAINRLPQVKQDIIVNMSDDMVFTTQGFDDVIRQGFTDYFPDLDGVLHFADPQQLENCMTMSIIGKNYFNLDGYIYHPDYTSLWCDVEAQDVARMRGRYRYKGNHILIFKHLHPSWGFAQMDAQYDKTESHEVRSKDQDVYERRKRNNFYL